MAEHGPLARSPIAPAPPEVVEAGWVVSGRRSDAPMTLSDLTPVAKVLVRGSFQADLADRFGVLLGRAGRREWELDSLVTVLVIGSGPGEWLVLAPPGRSKAVCRTLEDAAAPSAGLVTVLDVTHGRAVLRLSGAEAAYLLAKECGVDLSDGGFGDGHALRTGVSGIATDLIRDDVAKANSGATPSYLLHCERSSGQYLWDSLLDAGGELDIDIDGFRPPGI